MIDLRVPLSPPERPLWQQSLLRHAKAGRLEAGEVPAFVFQSVDPALFESQLRYLTENGYQGIGVDEYLAIARGAAKGTCREVLLTIDDARSSAWRFAYPLLGRHRQKAVLFVMTG